MQNLGKRLSALEQSQSPIEYRTIIRRIVSPGHLDAEIDHIRDDAGNEWTRQPGETEAAFTDRAKSETQPSKTGGRCLIASNMELHHAKH
jgi:hypothetical protein